MRRFKIILGRQLNRSRVGRRSFRFDNLVADQVLRVSLQRNREKNQLVTHKRSENGVVPVRLCRQRIQEKIILRRWVGQRLNGVLVEREPFS